MTDTYVTVRGWVGNDVVRREAAGVSVTTLRVASTARIKRKGDWIDGDTTWYSVTAWRTLADNVCESVKKGDAVIVHGRLRTESWSREDGQTGSSLVVEAGFIGHDLARGTSRFTRTTRSDRADSDPHDQVAEMIQQSVEEQPLTDPWDPERMADAPAQEERVA